MMMTTKSVKNVAMLLQVNKGILSSVICNIHTIKLSLKDCLQHLAILQNFKVTIHSF
jgi:hypothetical protein